MQQNFFCCPNKKFFLSNQNFIDSAKCFVGTTKKVLLHNYQQNSFVDLTKLFSQCIPNKTHIGNKNIFYTRISQYILHTKYMHLPLKNGKKAACDDR